MKLGLAWIVAGISVSYYGCAPTHEAQRSLTLSASEVIERIHKRDHAIHTVKGNGSITIESVEHSNTGSFEMSLRKPDSIRVDVSGPFGIRVGTLMLARERFLFYNWRNNTATIGKPDGGTFSSMLNITLQFDEILRTFTGEFFANSMNDSLREFSVNEGLYVIRYQSGNDVKEYRVDPNLFVVTSYRLLDSLDHPRIVTLASRFSDDTSIPLPALVRVIFPRERRSLTISYDDISLIDSVRCEFTPPQQSEVIYR